MKERKEYEEAKLEFIDFGAQDIITTSPNDTPSGEGTIGTAGWDVNGWT